MPSPLFEPLQLGGVTLSNRIAISPMCQYSADDGCMNDWHLIHLGQLACSGAGLLMVEATHVSREGRITHACAGLYSDRNEAAMKRVIDAARGLSRNAIGIQIAHAGRKASSQVPWEGREWLREGQSPWQTEAPSAIAFGEGWHTPRELTLSDLKRVRDQFAAAAQRARRIGFDVAEMHAAHGYLLHSFQSPLSNRRRDAYGEDRLRFPLEVAAALRDAWPRERALGARISASDWMEGGAGPDDAVAFAVALEKLGFDYVCVSSGAFHASAHQPQKPGVNLAFAEKVKAALKKMKVRAVGLIAEPAQAEAVVASDKADQVAMARAFLDNPRWVWHAAERFGVKLDYPPQYQRSQPGQWPGAKLARGGAA
jgi:2,4-dienoyl-CoA reductase-like NADH-dependent reductase (Old Yellow Enzyme family)